MEILFSLIEVLLIYEVVLILLHSKAIQFFIYIYSF